MAHYGWDDLIFTHLSARVPGPEHHFLINPYGMMFEEITASSLVKVNLEGQIVMPSPYFINPAGFTIHSAVHAAREDALCVIHLHTDYGIAVSAQKDGLLPISQQSLFALASLAYHDYEGLALNEDEKSRLVADLGNKTQHDSQKSRLADGWEELLRKRFSRCTSSRARAGFRFWRSQEAGRCCRFLNRFSRGVAAQLDAVTVGQGAQLAWPGLLGNLIGLIVLPGIEVRARSGFNVFGMLRPGTLCRTLNISLQICSKSEVTASTANAKR